VNRFRSLVSRTFRKITGSTSNLAHTLFDPSAGVFGFRSYTI